MNTEYNQQGKKYLIMRENLETHKIEEMDSFTKKKIANKLLKVYRKSIQVSGYYFYYIEMKYNPTSFMVNNLCLE